MTIYGAQRQMLSDVVDTDTESDGIWPVSETRKGFAPSGSRVFLRLPSQNQSKLRCGGLVYLANYVILVVKVAGLW
jgi:hypothetical protein